MSIYSRFGEKVTPVRMGVFDDYKKFEGRSRRIDRQDREIANKGLLFVARFECDGKERLCSVPMMRADGGINEIMSALAALRTEKTKREGEK